MNCSLISVDENADKIPLKELKIRHEAGHHGWEGLARPLRFGRALSGRSLGRSEFRSEQKPEPAERRVRLVALIEEEDLIAVQSTAPSPMKLRSAAER